jgi:hypothetical protein
MNKNRKQDRAPKQQAQQKHPDEWQADLIHRTWLEKMSVPSRISELNQCAPRSTSARRASTSAESTTRH